MFRYAPLRCSVKWNAEFTEQLSSNAEKAHSVKMGWFTTAALLEDNLTKRKESEQITFKLKI